MVGLGDLRSEELLMANKIIETVCGGESNKRKDGMGKQDQTFPHSIQPHMERLRTVITEWTPFLPLSVRKILTLPTLSTY